MCVSISLFIYVYICIYKHFNIWHIWHVGFHKREISLHFQISQCNNSEVCDISSFWSHGMQFFWLFWQNLKCWKIVEMSQMPQICCLYRALFQTLRKYLRFEAKFRCRLARTHPESWYWPRLRSRFEIRLGTTLTHRNWFWKQNKAK